MWKKNKDQTGAFLEEYALQTIRGVGNQNKTYNKIWNPGKNCTTLYIGN